MAIDRFLLVNLTFPVSTRNRLRIRFQRSYWGVSGSQDLSRKLSQVTKNMHWGFGIAQNDSKRFNLAPQK